MNSGRIFIFILISAFAAEVGVMVMLPTIFPGGHSFLVALLDACLLTAILAPLLWWFVARPLRIIALIERTRAMTIIETAPNGIVTMDREGRIRSFNRAAEKTFGYIADELLGQPFSQLVPTDPAVQNGRHLPEYLARECSTAPDRTVEMVGQTKSGNELSLVISVSDVVLDRRRRFTAVVRDLTERTLRMRQQAMASKLARGALACNDLHSLLEQICAAISETLNTEISCVWELLPDEQSFLLCAGTGWKDKLTGETTLFPEGASLDYWTVHDGETVFSTEATIGTGNPIPPLLSEHGVVCGINVLINAQDRPYGLLGAYSTRPRNFSEDSIHFLRTLASVITLSIERLRLEMKQREKDVFRAEQMAVVAQLATGVAHELRNPLTSVKMLVQASRNGSGDVRMPREDLAVIEEEIRRMERCLQTFLDYARPRQLERRLFDLASVIERTFALVEGRLGKQAVVPEFTPPSHPVFVKADWDQVQQLLLNLVLNALDAMPQGGTLSVEMETSGTGEVELRVLDTGPGIEPQMMSQLFQPFATSKETGVGLGLVISQRIAEEHGGTLTARNRPEGGACLVLRLPLHLGRPYGLAHSLC